jgi:uncharacterized membrane protein YraQ (UPF0718 family)
MNKENCIKLLLLLSFITLFLMGSRFNALENKVDCSKGVCKKPHHHGELNYHERFEIEATDNMGIAVLKSCANFWEANATGMTFAIIIGAAALSLLLSWDKLKNLLANKGIKGAAIGSIMGMPLNMCANCSAVTSIGLTSKNGSAEATLGIILGGALLNMIGIFTLLGLFHPAVVIVRLFFSAIMILVVVPQVSKLVNIKSEEIQKNTPLNLISCYFPDKNWINTLVKSFEDWLIAVGSIAYKLIPLMLLGTLITAIFRVIFPNELLHTIEEFNPIYSIIVISFIGTLLSIPVLFEILLGTIMLQLGFSVGAIAAMVFTAPSFGLFTLVLTKNKLGGYKVPLIIIGVTFILGIGAGLLANFLVSIF